jgi:hypothetical protein
VFRPVKRDDKVRGEAMSEKVVWQMVHQYSTDARADGIAPHDCRQAVSGRGREA